MYLKRGYALLESIAVNMILAYELEDDKAHLTMMNIPMKSEYDQSDPFSVILTNLFNFMILLIYIPPVYNTIYLIVQEKETRIKESMRMMGMTDVPYWLSWFIFFAFINTLLATSSWFLLIWNVINHSSKFLIWLFLWLYGLAVFGQIAFMQSFFEKAKHSGVLGSVIYFGCFMLTILTKIPNMSKGAKLILSLIPQVAMSQMCEVFGILEGSGQGLTFGTITKDIANFNFLDGIIMLTLDCVLFIFLGLYLD
jgi:ATP-binding cassette subfamily A (ABC1) protein 3